jgi:pseudaminic acid cytidylyltransferase
LLAIIPARGGSRRIPRKNIQPFHGKPIIAYSIELAKQAFMRPIVTTDDEEIAKVAREYGAEVFWRGPGLEVDEVGTQEVAKEVFDEIDDRAWFGCVLYATAPLLDKYDLFTCNRMLFEEPHMSYVYSTQKDGQDSGGFYFGYVEAWRNEIPLEGNSIPLITDDIDINTPEDWALAEALYEN